MTEINRSTNSSANRIQAYPVDTKYETKNLQKYYDQLDKNIPNGQLGPFGPHMNGPYSKNPTNAGHYPQCLFDNYSQHATNSDFGEWQGGPNQDDEQKCCLDNNYKYNDAHRIWQQNQPYDRDGKASDRGQFWFQLNTSNNGKVARRWFDIGDLCGKNYNYTIPSHEKIQSSWLKNATGIWFVFDGKGTTETRDCYARVDQAALRYANYQDYTDNQKRLTHYILFATEKLGDLSYGTGMRGNQKRILGYQVDSKDRQFVKDNKLELIGCRIQISLTRGSSGTTNDTVRAGLHGLRFSFGNAKLNSSITPNTKWVMCGSRFITMQDRIEGTGDKYWLETLHTKEYEYPFT